jgi:hypothetical protein
MSAPIRRAARGPMFAAAVRTPVAGEKRRKVLTMLGAYADAGINDPAIRELAAGAKLPKSLVCRLVDLLERDGLISIARRRGPDRRNVYRLTFNPQNVGIGATGAAPKHSLNGKNGTTRPPETRDHRPSPGADRSSPPPGLGRATGERRR